MEWMKQFVERAVILSLPSFRKAEVLNAIDFTTRTSAFPAPRAAFPGESDSFDPRCVTYVWFDA